MKVFSSDTLDSLPEAPRRAPEATKSPPGGPGRPPGAHQEPTGHSRPPRGHQMVTKWSPDPVHWGGAGPLYLSRFTVPVQASDPLCLSRSTVPVQAAFSNFNFFLFLTILVRFTPLLDLHTCKKNIYIYILNSNSTGPIHSTPGSAHPAPPPLFRSLVNFRL